MANKIWVNFYSRVYKDQTVLANVGKFIEVGDTVNLKKRVVGGTDVLEPVTITAVKENNHSIQWDNGTTGVRAEDIVGISAKHSFRCAGSTNTLISITELTPLTLKMAVTSITINGGVFPVNISEAVAANGIEVEFAQALTAAVNGYLAGTSGYASYSITGTAGTQVLAILITGSVLKPTAMAITGGTVVFS